MTYYYAEVDWMAERKGKPLIFFAFSENHGFFQSFLVTFEQIPTLLPNHPNTRLKDSIMVLSWWLDPIAFSNRSFAGGTDIKQLLFFFENVLMRGRADYEKASEILMYLDDGAFVFYFDTLSSDENLRDELKIFQKVKDSLLETFQETEEAQCLIHLDLNCSLNVDGHIESLCGMDRAFSKSNFYSEAKLGLLRNPSMEIPELSQLVIFRASLTSDHAKKFVSDFNSENMASILPCPIKTNSTSSLYQPLA